MIRVARDALDHSFLTTGVHLPALSLSQPLDRLPRECLTQDTSHILNPLREEGRGRHPSLSHRCSPPSLATL